MKNIGGRFAVVAALALFTCLLFAHPFAPAQQRESLPAKVQPREKVAPNKPIAPSPGSVPQFKIGEFSVIVDTGKTPAARGLTTPNLKNPAAQPAVQSAEGLAGQGHVLIKGQRVNVTFSGIKFAQSRPGQIPVATTGTVKGTPGGALEYAFNGYRIKIERQTVLLTPNSATAAAVVSLVQAPFMAAGTADNVLTLTSGSSSLSPDGGIGGKNFRGSSTFPLRDSVYRLRLDPEANQSVLLGHHKPAPQQSTTSLEGVLLAGIASTLDNLDVFNFNGAIGGDGKSARFDLALLPAMTSVVRSPEPGYELTLLSGSVNCRYETGGKLECEGVFGANLKLPPAIVAESGGQVSLPSISLKTDQTGALFNKLSLPGRLRAGFGGATPEGLAIFLLEPSPDAAYVYFPVWQAPRNSSYPMITANQKPSDVTPGCQELDDFLMKAPGGAIQKERLAPTAKAQPKAIPLRPQVKPLQAGSLPAGPLGVNEDARLRNDYGRPGLTIFQGTLYFRSPQATFPDERAQPDGEFNLKTRFFGLLTATPWGLNGSLTSSGNSFVVAAASKPIEDCSAPSGAAQPTWDEIVSPPTANQPLKPDPKPGRFRLAELRVLEMRVETLGLCMNALPDKGATMAYVVHFPFPSCVDLDFIDQSLDAQGRFHTALGPLAPEAQTITGPSAGKKAVVTIPQVRILWAWRLPVTLADRDVAITYPTGPGPAGIQVPPPGGQQRSELWLRPLYSKNSELKAGVRFSATLTPKGVFDLKDWDRAPILCGAYPAPGQEMEMGFECSLSGITLADAGAAYDPAGRSQDFGWSGKVKFPFFGRQGVAFGVKDLVPGMPGPIDMTNNGSVLAPCPNGRNGTLGVRIRGLRYRTTGYPFVSEDVVYWESPENTAAGAERVEFGSFLSAQVRLRASRPEDKNLSPYILPGPAEPEQAEHWLRNAVSSKSLIDLGCYDKDVLDLRGPSANCCSEYWVGTYEVTAGPPNSRKVILTAPNVKCDLNAQPVVLGFNGSQMTLTPEGGQSGNKTLINIPGARLKLEGGALRGSFSTGDIAMFLPNIGGECTFFLDVHKGHFALMIGGSYPITPFPINVEGEVFIFHAPLSALRSPGFGRDDSIINRATEWALFPPSDSLETATGLADIHDPRAVISGLLLSGNGAALVDLKVTKAKVARGAGLFFYHFDSSGSGGYRCGYFQTYSGEVDLKFIDAAIFANWSVTPAMPDTFDGVKAFFQDSNLTLHGQIWAYACASCLLAHAYVVLDLQAWISIQDGFGCEGRFGADAGAGGCPERPRY